MRLAPLLVAIGLVVLTAPAMAFNSVPFGGIHATITEAALASSGLSPRAVAAIVEANWRTDFDEMTVGLWPVEALFVPNGRYEAGHHFDRGGADSHAVAFGEGAAFVSAMRREAAAQLTVGQREAGLWSMGRGLHALQDFCSHSNVVELSVGEQEAVATILAGLPGEAPEALRITGYDPETGHDPPGDPYGHGAFNKDAPARAQHEPAFRMAVALSRAFVGQVREDVGAPIWRELAH